MKSKPFCDCCVCNVCKVILRFTLLYLLPIANGAGLHRGITFAFISMLNVDVVQKRWKKGQGAEWRDAVKIVTGRKCESLH